MELTTVNHNDVVVTTGRDEWYNNTRVHNKTQQAIGVLQSLQQRVNQGLFGPSDYLDVVFELEQYIEYLSDAIEHRQNSTPVCIEDEVQVWQPEAVAATV